MSFRYLFIISLNLKSVLYLRRFANIEKRAQRLGLQEIDIKSDDQLINSLFTSLAITTTKDSSEPEFQCFVGNQLPVIELTYNKTKLWPILVVEQNGLLFCCYPLCESKSKSLIDFKSISLCFTSLQTIARYFSSEKGLSWIEWFITSLLPFGALVHQKYEPLNRLINKTIVKTDINSQNDLKLIINELISRNKDKELVYGTINTDHSYCWPQLIDNCVLNVRLRNVESLNLVLPPNCSPIGPHIQIRPALQFSPLHVIHYKCNSTTVPMKTFLSYSYHMNRLKTQKNLHKIHLTLELKNSTQFKFNYFNIQFKHSSDNSCLTPIRSNLTFGQLRYESIGLFWVIGTKFPKTGQMKLNFEIICLNNKLLEMETICNFKIENFESSLLYADSDHLTVDDFNVVGNAKITPIIDSTLTAIDYKLFPEIN